MVVTGRRARKQSAEVRRETLVEAAVQVFAQTSYRAAGTAEIARVAGVAEPTIYRYFESKRALYLAALTRCGEIVRDEFRSIADRTPDAFVALNAMGEWYGHMVDADPAYLRLRQRAIAETDDAEVRTMLRRIYDEIRGVAADVIRRGQAQGTINADVDPEAGAWLFLAIGQVMDLGRLIGMTPEECGNGCDLVAGIAKQALSGKSA